MIFSRAVKKGDWDVKPIPSSYETFRFEYAKGFSDNDIKKLRKGHIPLEQEDKHFIYAENDTIQVISSWSGIPKYTIFLPKEAGTKVSVYAYCDMELMANKYAPHEEIQSAEEKQFEYFVNYYLGADYENYSKWYCKNHKHKIRKGF